MTVTDDRASMADAQQAAYFRAELQAEREQLIADIGKRRALIERPSEVSRHQRATLHSAEAEIRYLDSLIARLDSRFASQSV